MGEKRGNFDKVKIWINNSLPFLHVHVRVDHSLLEFARMIERINDGISLPSEVMKNGQLTSESASIIRDIMRSNPKISFISFTQLYNQFFVLLHGRVAKESEFPMIVTIRGHICQLDNYDQHEKRELIKIFPNTWSLDIMNIVTNASNLPVSNCCNMTPTPYTTKSKKNLHQNLLCTYPGVTFYMPCKWIPILY